MKATLAALVVLALAWPVTSQALDLGDKAPDFTADVWINGSPANPGKPDGKTTYVLEFWATWCPPCKRSIPELNRIFQKYKDQNVAVIGVTSEPEDTVRPFVEKMDMKYVIAIDTNRAFLETYMADIPGIPYAFIIDTNGVVVWSGHPTEHLDESLRDILAGTYDIDTAAETESADEELQRLLMGGDLENALTVLDKLLSKNKDNFEYYELKITILAQLGQFDRAKGVYKEVSRVYADSAENLNTLAWMIAVSPFEMCDLQLAWSAATRAVELSQRENSAILDTLARVYYAAGLLDLAMATQREAVEKSNSDDRDSLKATLDFYTSAASLREMIEKSANPGASSP